MPGTVVGPTVPSRGATSGDDGPGGRGRVGVGGRVRWRRGAPVGSGAPTAGARARADDVDRAAARAGEPGRRRPRSSPARPLRSGRASAAADERAGVGQRRGCDGRVRRSPGPGRPGTGRAPRGCRRSLRRRRAARQRLGDPSTSRSWSFIARPPVRWWARVRRGASRGRATGWPSPCRAGPRGCRRPPRPTGPRGSGA